MFCVLIAKYHHPIDERIIDGKEKQPMEKREQTIIYILSFNGKNSNYN